MLHSQNPTGGSKDGPNKLGMVTSSLGKLVPSPPSPPHNLLLAQLRPTVWWAQHRPSESLSVCACCWGWSVYSPLINFATGSLL